MQGLFQEDGLVRILIDVRVSDDCVDHPGRGVHPVVDVAWVTVTVAVLSAWQVGRVRVAPALSGTVAIIVESLVRVAEITVEVDRVLVDPRRCWVGRDRRRVGMVVRVPRAGPVAAFLACRIAVTVPVLRVAIIVVRFESGGHRLGVEHQHHRHEQQADAEHDPGRALRAVLPQGELGDRGRLAVELAPYRVGEWAQGLRGLRLHLAYSASRLLGSRLLGSRLLEPRPNVSQLLLERVGHRRVRRWLRNHERPSIRYPSNDSRLSSGFSIAVTRTPLAMQIAGSALCTLERSFVSITSSSGLGKRTP